MSHDFIRLAQQARGLKSEAAQGRLVIGYVSGSASHDQDFETISDALCHVMDKYPQVELHIIGHLSLSERWAPYRQRIHLTPLLPWQDVPRESQVIDINLAPLE